MNKVKWGVLGTAGIAKGATIPGMLLADNCEVYAIAGRNPDKVKDFVSRFGFKKSYLSYDELINDPDIQAVYIPLPNNLHKEWVIKALRAGKNVLCEKPLALNADDAREMYAVARETGKILMEAYAYLHSPYMESLIADVKGGLIGDPVYIDTSFMTQGYKEDFRLHKEFGGGMIYDLGCYCTTMILSMIDSDIDYVKCVAEMTDEGVDAFAGAIMGFKNGARAAFNVGMVMGIGSNARFDRLYIRGTKGEIHSMVPYNESGDVSYTVISEGKHITRMINVPSNYTLEVTDLGESILTGKAPLVTPEFSIRNAELLDKLLNCIGY